MPRFDEPTAYQEPGYQEPGYREPGHREPGHPEPAPGPGTRSGRRRSRPPGRSKVGLLLGIVGGVLALVLVGGAAVVLLNGSAKPGPGKDAGSESVHPDFADPGKVVDSWLNAMFIHKDPDKMLRYTCKKEAKRDEVEDAIKGVEKAEKDAKDAKLSMKVSWSKPKVATTSDTSAKVTTTLKAVVGDKTKNTPARFDLVNEAGWKVCDTEMT